MAATAAVVMVAGLGWVAAERVAAATGLGAWEPVAGVGRVPVRGRVRAVARVAAAKAVEKVVGVMVAEAEAALAAVVAGLTLAMVEALAPAYVVMEAVVEMEAVD